LKRYIIIFTISYVILLLLLGGLAEILKLSSGTAFAVAAVGGASFFAAAAFAKDHARPPTGEEKTSFAWRALLSVWVVSLLFSAVFIASQVPAGELRGLLRSFTSGSALALGAGFFLFASALHYFAIRWSFGWYAGRTTGGGA
jgi:hypothetical protein